MSRTSAIDILKSDPAYTLVVVNGERVRTYRRRGVIDLLETYDHDPGLLRGADVADKIVGKAAAAFMAEGRIKSVTTEKVTPDAIAMLVAAGVECAYTTVVPYVINRTNTGRCPLDTICSTLSDPKEMIAEIRQFIKSKQAQANV